MRYDTDTDEIPIPMPISIPMRYRYQRETDTGTDEIPLRHTTDKHREVKDKASTRQRQGADTLCPSHTSSMQRLPILNASKPQGNDKEPTPCHAPLYICHPDTPSVPKFNASCRHTASHRPHARHKPNPKPISWLGTRNGYRPQTLSMAFSHVFRVPVTFAHQRGTEFPF